MKPSFAFCLAFILLSGVPLFSFAQEPLAGADSASSTDSEPTRSEVEQRAPITNKPDRRPKLFLIGNSLTWDTVPSKLDGDVQWHVDCGKSLPYIYANPDTPCVKTSTLWPKALKETQFDQISFQPHYGSTVEEDAEVIGKWLAMQPKARVVIHPGWSRTATREAEYASKDADGMLQHSEAYFAALLNTLRQRHPNRDFSMTRSMTLLNEIAEEADRGDAPIDSVLELHRDAIHMNVTSGRYLMHNLMRQAFGQPISSSGFNLTEVSRELQEYLDAKLAKTEPPPN